MKVMRIDDVDGDEPARRIGNTSFALIRRTDRKVCTRTGDV